MAALFVDENFPLPAAQELRRLGYDIVMIQERGFGGGFGGQATPDNEVLPAATSDRRSVVTLNRRHFVRLASRIDAALRDHQQLDGRLVRVNRPA